ncbi:MAG: folate-binding protein YgfZ [Wenzhouxiangellaceae bacterium]
MSTDNTVVLNHLGRITVSGNDAADFLHRQLTCATSTLKTGELRYGSWCEPRGRVICDLLIGRDQDGLQLIMAGDQCQPVLDGLRRFVFRDAVVFSDAARFDIRGRWHDSTAAGDNALPWDNQRSLHWEGDTGGQTPDSQNEALHDWQLADLQCGVPWLQRSVSALFLPQMLGIDGLNAINYEKGCYPGQEVIARTHYLGRVKRHRIYFSCHGAKHPPAPGADIYNQNGEEAGTVVAVAGKDDVYHGLAVIGESFDHTDLHIGDHGHPTSLQLGEKQ